MKQLNVKLQSLSNNVISILLPKLILAVICVSLILGFNASIQADSLVVTIGDDSLYFSTVFPVIDYDSCAILGPVYTRSWQPDSLCDPKPTEQITYAKSISSTHFQILSEDSSCMLFDGYLEQSGPATAGDQPLEMSLPINQSLTNSSFTFDSSSYFQTMTIRGSHSVPGFQVERGQSYVFQITEQTNGGCSGDPDGERTHSGETLVALDCDTDDCCDVAGDANNDGSFSILDLTYLIDYFIRETEPAPDCLGEGDANGDCSLAEDDIDYMVASIFTGGPDPVCPSP